jgi:RND family efflux transporter MFP subunit
VINKCRDLLRFKTFVSTVFAVSFIASAAQAADYPAVLDWSGRVVLTLPVSGVLATVSGRAGQFVKKGELLASLEPTLFKAGVAEARADMDRLAEEHADAKRDMDRVQELYARTVASTTELDSAKLRFARASSGLAAAQARVERARRLLAESELRAPFDALILSRHGEPGLVITSQCSPPAVFTVVRSDEWVARSSVEASRSASLVLDAEVGVLVDKMTLKGKVNAVSLGMDNRYTLEVLLPRGASNLAVGQPVSVRVP